MTRTGIEQPVPDAPKFDMPAVPSGLRQSGGLSQRAREIPALRAHLPFYGAGAFLYPEPGKGEKPGDPYGNRTARAGRPKI